MLLYRTFIICFALLITSCSTTSSSTTFTSIEEGIYLERVFPELSRTNIVYMEPAPGIPDKLFLAAKTGQIVIIDTAITGVPETEFLDISGKVNSTGNEEGLLGFTFDNHYMDNRFFYVYYSASKPRRSVISRFTAEVDNLLKAIPGSEKVLLEVEQPYANHNGGHLQFGLDGFLYIGLGDGGSAGDPLNNGQDRQTLLGSILRINVHPENTDTGYTIPIDNPFSNSIEGFRGEIWAYGLRNPWKFAFDKPSGTLWAADVGQNKYEEINLIERGGNYGWNEMEGSSCYNNFWDISQNEDCLEKEFIPPVFTYTHDSGNCSVTGGYIYRGSKIESLRGLYIYADFCSGRIWGLERHSKGNVANTLLIDSDLTISSFAKDSQSELYVISYDGAIYRMTLTS